jgi:hypothetical protein
MNEKYEINSGTDSKGLYIRIRSINKAKHFAVYRSYTKRTNDNEENVPITTDVIDQLIKSIEKKGITEGFILNLDEKKFDEKENKAKKISPDDVRHQLSKKEINFTSTGNKLDYHWPIFWKLKDTDFGSIIRTTLTLHQVCSSHCHFCSTINRNKKDSISLEEAKNFIEKLYFDQAELNKTKFSKYNDKYKSITGSDIKLRSVILSGGGQPNLWPHFTEFVEWLSKLDLDIGLITNGFPNKIQDQVYDKFKWIRLSITPEDASPFYPDQKFDLQRIPQNIINGGKTFGLSYVYGPWTNDDIIARLAKTVETWKLSYIRMLTDCNLSRTEQLKAHSILAEKLYKLNIIDENGQGSGKIFHQLKYHGTQEEADTLWSEGKCFLQTYNVFWDTTGHEINGKSYCYPCDSVTVLAEENTRQQSKRGFDGNIWGTVTNDKVELLYKEKWKQFFDPRKHCSACLFMKNNNKVKSLKDMEINDLENIKFDSSLEHKNFP